MMEYKYTAITKGGKKKEGTIESDSAEKVASLLHDKDLTVVEIRESSVFDLSRLASINIGSAPLQDLVLFFRQMSYMLSSGLPLVNGLEVISKQARNKALKEAVKKIVEDVRGGAQLYLAMSKHPKIFDKISISLIRAGEESGNLDLIFDRLATDYEKRQSFIGKVRGAMIYPLIILVLMVVVVIALLIFMIPSLKDLFSEFGAKLPPATAFLVGLSDVFSSFWGVVILLVIAVAVLGVRAYRGSKEGKRVTDRLILKIPVFGQLTQKTLLAQFSRTFSMLLKSGVSILNSINLTADALGNEVFAEALTEAAAAVERGGSLAKVISEKEEFPPIVSEMIAVGEKTGKLDDITAKMGDYFEREADQMASDLTKFIEPVIMVVVGGMVLFIALAVYTPLMSLGDVIK